MIMLESLSLALVRSEELGVRSGGAAHKNMEAPRICKNRSSRIAKPLPIGKGPPSVRGIGWKVCRQLVSRYGADYGMCRMESVVKQT